MRRKNYTQEQIVKAIKSHESAVKVLEICQELGIIEHIIPLPSKVCRHGSVGGETSAQTGSREQQTKE